jgi:hypothetical protein
VHQLLAGARDASRLRERGRDDRQTTVGYLLLSERPLDDPDRLAVVRWLQEQAAA